MCSKNYINEDNYIDEQNEPHKTYKHIKKSKYHKKTGNKCYCLNMLEQSGPIYIINHPECSYFFVSKMELVKFNDHFDGLFEKGKYLKKSKSKMKINYQHLIVHSGIKDIIIIPNTMKVY